jgi:hypothetical protein
MPVLHDAEPGLGEREDVRLNLALAAASIASNIASAFASAASSAARRSASVITASVMHRFQAASAS